MYKAARGGHPHTLRKWKEAQATAGLEPATSAIRFPGLSQGTGTVGIAALYPSELRAKADTM